MLTEEQTAFFDQNGFLVLPGAVSPEDCEAVVTAIYEFLEVDPAKPERLYHPPLEPGGMVELYQHQSLWNNRQNETLYRAFADLFRTPNLWVTMDRVNLKPPFHPAHPEYDHKGFTHWDCDTSKWPVPFGLQGVLALRDTDESMGGFQCIPGFHRNLKEWMDAQPEGRSSFYPDLTRLPQGRKVTPIPMKQGDFVIWHRLLAHGNGRNLSNKPRLCQYISYFPAPDLEKGDEDGHHRQERIGYYERRVNPTAPYFPGDPRGWEAAHFPPANLTPLGRKLLGIDLY